MNIFTFKYLKIILASAFIILAISYKWAILSRIGIVPKDICSPKVMTTYLKQGGNPNAWINTWDWSAPIVHCFAEVDSKESLELFVQKGGNLDYAYWGGNTIWTEAKKRESALILLFYVKNNSNFSDKRRQEILQHLLPKTNSIK